MISLLNSFNVPYLDYITIFPDSMLPTKFYYFRTHPKLSYDSKHNVPLIDYKLIQHTSDGQDKDIDTQFGYLTMTVDLGLTQEEETQIRKAVYAMLNDADYRATMELLYPEAYAYYDANKNTDKISEAAIQLSNMGVIKNGTTKFEIWEGFGKDIKRESSTEAKPSSSGNYATPLYASFGKWGSQLVAKSLRVSTDTDDGLKAIPTTAIVRYEIEVPFHVPALKAKVVVDTDDFYHYLTELFSDENSLNGTYRGRLNTKEDGVADNFKNGVGVRGEILLSEEDIEDLLTKYHESNKTGIVQIQDYSAIAGTGDLDLRGEILKSVLGIVTNQIIPAMFEPSPVPTKTDTEASGSVYAGQDPDEVARMVYYRFKDSEESTEKKHIEYDFSMQSMTVLPLCASTTLLAVVPKDYADKVVTLINLESTEFNDHRVNISSPIDFGANKISTIELIVRYDEPDARFPDDKQVKEDDFTFKTGTETFGFSYFESKDNNGKFLPEFKYKTKVSYKGKGHIDQNEGWSEWMKTSTHNLLIKPETTGFISVECEMGDIDWDIIKRVDVTFTYPPALGKTDAQDTLRFKKDEGVKNWNCYRYGSQSDEYTYEVTYEDLNGSRYSAPKKSSTALHICVDDLYEGPALEGEFSVNFSPTIVEYVRVYVDYDGKVEHHDLKENEKCWTWKKSLRKGSPETFRYKYYVAYKDTTSSETEWSAPCGKGSAIPIYTVEMKPLAATSAKIQVSAQLLAMWDKFAFVQVFATYDDPDHGIHHEFEAFTLDKANMTKTLDLPCPPNSAKPFKISAVVYDLDGLDHPYEEKEYSRSCMLPKPQV